MDSQPPEFGTQRDIQTGGGAYVGESVHTHGGDFVGRDKITNVGYTADEVAQLLAQARPHDPQPQGFTRKPFEPETIIVLAGVFTMGRNPGDGVSLEETPQHTVELPSYRIGKTLVSNRQYAEFIRQTGRLVSPAALWNGQKPLQERLDEPVTGVTFVDAVAYCDWLNKQIGRNYRPPNEAQWEKAADCAPDQGFVWGGTPEWTCTLWGEKLRHPDPQFAYPWQDDDRNDVTAGSFLRRVVRGATASVTARSGTAPDQPGPPGRRHGFRVALVQ